MREKLGEECGVLGVVLKTDEATGVTYNVLLSLQNRGQEGAGIAVLKNSSILHHKNTGFVGEVFSDKTLEHLPSDRLAIGHVRYSTTGANCMENVQPVVTAYLRGRIAAAHNGNIVNAIEIKKKLQADGCDFAATNDSEIISSLIAYEALSGCTMEDAVVRAARRLKGAFSIVVLSSKNKLLAFRDPWGFRPLCIGKSEHGVAVASESCALDSAGFRFIRDIDPGELVIVNKEGEITSYKLAVTAKGRGNKIAV